MLRVKPGHCRAQLRIIALSSDPNNRTFVCSDRRGDGDAACIAGHVVFKLCRGYGQRRRVHAEGATAADPPASGTNHGRPEDYHRRTLRQRRGGDRRPKEHDARPDCLAEPQG